MPPLAALESSRFPLVFQRAVLNVPEDVGESRFLLLLLLI